jgi:hypothetical protein
MQKSGINMATKPLNVIIFKLFKKAVLGRCLAHSRLLCVKGVHCKWKKPTVFCCRLTRLQLPLSPAQLSRSVLPFLSHNLSSLCVQGKLSHLTGEQPD